MLFTLFETFVLIWNAFAILNEKRFLAKCISAAYARRLG